MPERTLTKCELEVMDVVWDKEHATVQDVVDALERPLAYTTVMTTLKILEKKKIVARKSKSGRAYVYVPLISREEISRSMAAHLTQYLFDGSLKSFVLSLIDSGSMSRADIRELQRAIKSLEKNE
jgi:predicted transcriptional regulator